MHHKYIASTTECFYLVHGHYHFSSIFRRPYNYIYILNKNMKRIINCPTCYKYKEPCPYDGCDGQHSCRYCHSLVMAAATATAVATLPPSPPLLSLMQRSPGCLPPRVLILAACIIRDSHFSFQSSKAAKS